MNPVLVEIIGALAALITSLCWIPQAWHTIRTRDTSGISLAMQAGFNVGIALWLVYGLAIGSWPLIAANAVTLALVGTILVLKLRYG